MRSSPLLVVLTVLALLVGVAPASGYVANDDAFAERYGGSGGRSGTGVHPAAGDARWVVPLGFDGGAPTGPLLLDRDGHVLSFAETGTGVSRMVAHDLTTGGRAWATDGAAERLDADCVVVVPDGMIWAQTGDGTELVAIDPATGAVDDTVAAPAGGCTTGLQAVAGNALAYIDFCCSDRLHVVDLRTGTARAMPAEVILPDLLLTSADGTRAYVMTPGRELLAVDLATGTVLDRLLLPDALPHEAMRSSVVRDDGAIFLTLSGDPGAVVRVDDDGTGALDLRWSTATAGDVGPRPATLLIGGPADDLVVGWQAAGSADTLLALDAETGAVAYRASVPAGPSGGIATGAMLVDGAGNVVVPQIISRSTDDGAVLYDVLSPEGIPLGRSPLDAGTGVAGMVLTDDGTLVVRTSLDDNPILTAYAAGKPGISDIPLQVTPRTVGAGIATLRITGPDVPDATRIRLQRGTDVRSATPVPTARRNPLERQARFDLRGAAPGTWDVLLSRGADGTTPTRLQVEVVPADDKATLRVDLQQPTAVRNGRTGAVSVTVTNTANIDADVVPVVVATTLAPDDPRQLTALAEAAQPDGTPQPPGGHQWSADRRIHAIAIPWVPGGGSVTLPFLLEVPDDAPAEGTVDIQVATTDCIVPPAPAFAQVGADPCFDAAVAGVGDDALGVVAQGAAQCLALQLAEARRPRVEGDVVVVPDTTNIDVGGLARACYLDAAEEAGGVSHPVVTIFKAEAFALGVVTGYLDCGLATADGHDRGATMTGSSVDPNELHGPPGAGEPRYLTDTRPLDYQILFENLPAAAFAAQVVAVTTTLDADVDPTTVALGPLGWGEVRVDPPPVGDAFTTVVTPEGADHQVRVDFSRDGRDLTWRLTTLGLDGGPPTDDAVGFLPPNTAPPAGDGFVSYRVSPAASVADGTVIEATADIVFDTNPAIVTNTWSNTVDRTPPTTTIEPPPDPSPSNTVTFGWTSADDTSGVVRHLVDRLDPPTTALGATTPTTSPALQVVGRRGERITLRVRAVDGAGNVEPAATAPTATTTIAVDALDRLSGPTRIGTAIDISRRVFGTSGVAVLARADTFPDSLAGATLAHDLSAPLLLTDRERIDDTVLAELHRLGVGGVVLLGGTAAVGQAVVDALHAEGFTVERVAGGDRFGTAAAVASLLPPGDHAFITVGRVSDAAGGWHDALLTAPWAARTGDPLLLVEGEGLPPATRQALADRGVARVTIVGSTAAVPDSTVAELQAMGIDVDRIAGADPGSTGIAVSQAAVGAGGGARAATWLATSRVFADALSAGAAVAATGGTLLLVDGLDVAASEPVLAHIAEVQADIEVLRIAGGVAAVSPDVEQAVRAALR